MELINNLDIWLFHVINKGFANPLFDFVMPFITTNQNWILVYVFFLSWMIWKGEKRHKYAFIVLIVTIIFVDQMNSAFLKDIFGRLRPCQVLSDVRLLVPCGGGKSFPSSHASNTFAAATVLSYFIREYKYIFYSLAVLISFSRIYYGVHYPADVFAGAVFGVLSAVVFIFIFLKIEKLSNKKNLQFKLF
ncbi:MAG: phosphatase PAP2 family protein [Bacteroidota bacterium]